MLQGSRPRLWPGGVLTTICPACLVTGSAVTHPPLFGSPGTVIHLKGSIEVGPDDRQLGTLRDRLMKKDHDKAEVIRRLFLTSGPPQPSLRYDQRQFVERELEKLGVTERLLSFDQADVEIRATRLLQEAAHPPANSRQHAREFIEAALQLPQLVHVTVWQCRCGKSSAAYADGPPGRGIDQLELQLVSHVHPDDRYSQDASLEPHWRDVAEGLAALGHPPAPALVTWLQQLLDEFARTPSHTIELLDVPGSAWARKLLMCKVKQYILQRASDAAPPAIAPSVLNLRGWLGREVRDGFVQSLAALRADSSLLAKLEMWVDSGQLGMAEAELVRAAVVER